MGEEWHSRRETWQIPLSQRTKVNSNSSQSCSRYLPCVSWGENGTLPVWSFSQNPESQFYQNKIVNKSQYGDTLQNIWPVLLKTGKVIRKGGAVVKNLPASAEDVGSISGLGRSLGVGNSNPFQYSCFENSMHRGAWWGYHPRLSKHAHTHTATARAKRNPRRHAS